MSRGRSVRVGLGLLILILLPACQGVPLSERRWGGGTVGQGSIDRQKARAVTFDPYPLNDIGPEVVGGRPREYAQPLPEATRNELTSPWRLWSR